MTSLRRLEDILRRDTLLVALILVTVVLASWLYLLAGAGTGMQPHEAAMIVPDQAGIAGISMPPVRWSSGYAVLMFFMWWLMMIAMMLPSTAPMVLLHAAVTRKGVAQMDGGGANATSHSVLPATGAFVSGYLVLWGVFSLLAAAAQWGLERGALLSSMMTSTSRMLGAGLLLGAGLWQFTPLKSACLRHCRSPAGFLAAHWRPGVGGAFRMGAMHGVYCLGCCWSLMALLFYGGVMNLVWIIALALFVLAEKLFPAGVGLGRVTGLLLMAWGVWLGFTAA